MLSVTTYYIVCKRYCKVRSSLSGFLLKHFAETEYQTFSSLSTFTFLVYLESAMAMFYDTEAISV